MKYQDIENQKKYVKYL